MPSIERSIFRRGSTTYYFSSLFFPRSVRRDVFRLYSFVRLVDNYVDCFVPQAEKFQSLRKLWDRAKNDMAVPIFHSPFDSVDDRVIKNMLYLKQKYRFDPIWIETFLDTMQSDLQKQTFNTLGHSLRYIAGSAEVVGLMMAKIMKLPDEALEFAKFQGRAMQWLNFIRDITEDNALGRCYFPTEDLDRFGISDFRAHAAKKNPKPFKKFIDFELGRYHSWQKQAQQGFRFIPRRLLIPLQTAVDMHNRTAHQIEQNPLLVFERKVKPTKLSIIRRALKNSISMK